MQKPSAPPLELLTVYPKNNSNYSQFHDINDNLSNTQQNNNLRPFENSQIIIIEKKNNDDDLVKVGCAAALLTFCCMQ